MEMIGVESESVESGGSGTKFGVVALVDHGLRSEAFDPRERGGVREPQVVGEKEDKGFVVGVGTKEDGVFFTLMAEVVVVAGFEIAQ